MSRSTSVFVACGFQTYCVVTVPALPFLDFVAAIVIQIGGGAAFRLRHHAAQRVVAVGRDHRVAGILDLHQLVPGVPDIGLAGFILGQIAVLLYVGEVEPETAVIWFCALVVLVTGVPPVVTAEMLPLPSRL